MDFLNPETVGTIVKYALTFLAIAFASYATIVHRYWEHLFAESRTKRSSPQCPSNKQRPNVGR